MEASELKYPVLALMGHGVFVYSSSEHLLTAYLSHLKDGLYNSAVLVDRTGQSYNMRHVASEDVSLLKRLIDPLIQQKVRISCQIQRSEQATTLEDLKRFITKEVGPSGKWEIQGDNADFLTELEKANSLNQLLAVWSTSQLPRE